MSGKIIRIAGAILAGGKNSRMGGITKGLIEVSGETIFERTLGILEEHFEEIIIVANKPEVFKGYSKRYVIISDILQDKGPLGGIHAALSYTKKEAVFFAAGDMPFLGSDIILKLINNFKIIDSDALLPRVGNQIEPLCAIYKSFLKDNIQDYITNNHDFAVKSFLKNVKVDYLKFEDNCSNRRLFKNVNTPEDAQQMRFIMEREGL